ncbi:MAG: sulfonate transport system ATP-binding protein [Myxococcales bacterium]|jgi:NitT/TauT family transport system ATP-binding protein|nr:sulfonate transport system ATP-binding protein [Myxococcales bacterium]
MTAPAGRLTARQLTLALGSGAARQLVIERLTLDAAPGEIVTVLGPSGCGKSTLLSALAGLVAPSGGTLSLDDQPLDGPHPALGLVFQQNTLLPWKTVEDNVAFGLKMRGQGRRARRTAALEMLNLVGLSGLGDRYPSQLSGGMQQRVEIARVLVNQPRVLLMDEPFAALDAQTRLMMQELLLEIWARVRVTIVFVTHDIDEAILLGDRVVVLTQRPGRIRETLPVPIARPRRAEVTTSAAFTDLKRRCLALVREETLQGLAAAN